MEQRSTIKKFNICYDALENLKKEQIFRNDPMGKIMKKICTY